MIDFTTVCIINLRWSQSLYPRRRLWCPSLLITVSSMIYPVTYSIVATKDKLQLHDQHAFKVVPD